MGCVTVIVCHGGNHYLIVELCGRWILDAKRFKEGKMKFHFFPPYASISLYMYGNQITPSYYTKYRLTADWNEFISQCATMGTYKFFCFLEKIVFIARLFLYTRLFYILISILICQTIIWPIFSIFTLWHIRTCFLCSTRWRTLVFRKKQYKHEMSEYHNQICPTILEALSFYMGKTLYVLKIFG